MIVCIPCTVEPAKVAKQHGPDTYTISQPYNVLRVIYRYQKQVGLGGLRAGVWEIPGITGRSICWP